MRNRLKGLLSRRFQEFDGAERPIAVLDVLETDRPIVEASLESPGRDRLGVRSVTAFAALVMTAAVVVFMLFTDGGERPDTVDPVAVLPPSTAASPEEPSLTVTDVEPTATSLDLSSLDLLEPVFAGDALDVGWTVVERQFDLTSFGEPGPHPVSDSAELFWGLGDSSIGFSRQLYVSDDGSIWDPVVGRLPLEPGLNIWWTTLLRIGDTIVATFHWPDKEAMWVSVDRGRSFERVEIEAFDNTVFAWSWVADDTFWQIVEDPERSNNPSPLVGERVNDETMPRQLWSSTDGATWSLVGDVDGLPAWDGGQNHSGPHAVKSDNGLLLAVNRPTFGVHVSDGTVIRDNPIVYRSEDAGLTWRAYARFPTAEGRSAATIGDWFISGGPPRMERFRYVSTDGVKWYRLDVSPHIDIGAAVVPTLVDRRIAIPPQN